MKIKELILVICIFFAYVNAGTSDTVQCAQTGREDPHALNVYGTSYYMYNY